MMLTNLGEEVSKNKDYEDMLNQYLKQVQLGELQSPAENIFKNLERNEKSRRDHDHELIQGMKKVLQTSELDKEQRKALLHAQEHKEFIIDPKVLDPLVSTYDKTNEAYQVENMTLRSDTARLCDVVDMMVKDNTKLREFINKKNSDMSKVLTTLSEEEGDIIQGLKDNINIIEEENQHLIFKIEQLEELLEKERQLSRDAVDGAQDGRKINRRMAEDLHDLQLREKTNTEKLMLMEQQLQKLQDELAKATESKDKAFAQLEVLRREKENANRDSLNLNHQISADFDRDTGKKTRLSKEEEFNDMVQELLILREEVQYLKSQAHPNIADEREGTNIKDSQMMRESVRAIQDPNQSVLQNLSRHISKIKHIPKDTVVNASELDNKVRQLVKENEQLQMKLNNTEKKLKLLQNLQMDSQIRQIGSNNNPIEIASNETARLKAELMIKKNEADTEKRQSALFIKQMEQINKELVDKLSEENDKLKADKMDLFVKSNQLIERNMELTKQLELHKVNLDNSAKTYRIQSLQEDNQELKNQIEHSRELKDRIFELEDQVRTLSNFLGDGIKEKARQR